MLIKYNGKSKDWIHLTQEWCTVVNKVINLQLRKIWEILRMRKGVLACYGKFYSRHSTQGFSWFPRVFKQML
jgi:hypothetical protein